MPDTVLEHLNRLTAQQPGAKPEEENYDNMESAYNNGYEVAAWEAGVHARAAQAALLGAMQGLCTDDLNAAHDALSELLEDEDAGNDEIREAAIHLCVILASHHERLRRLQADIGEVEQATPAAPLPGDLREALVDACARDAAVSLADDRGFRLEVSRNGFAGFSRLCDTDLVRAFCDAGLDSLHPELGAAISRLEQGGASPFLYTDEAPGM